jgi:hypothetical protein
MPKYFSVEEANALLPQVQPGLEECQRIVAEARPIQEALMQAARTSRGNGHGDEGDLQAKAQRAQELSRRLQEIVGQIQSLGVEIKDIDRGLIDFRSEREGREIYLCWMLGEGDTIAWWHPIETGFSGRQPI